MHPDRSRTRRVIGVASVGVLVADQASKALAGLVTTRYRNPDFALGLGTAPRAVMVVTITAVTLLAARRLVGAAERGRIAAVAAALIIGGAVGNLLDRVLFGAVHDFLALGPIVANVADIAVLVGVVGCARSVHFHDRRAGFSIGGRR
jgi:lipoprotein signal peptidase